MKVRPPCRATLCVLLGFLIWVVVFLLALFVRWATG